MASKKDFLTFPVSDFCTTIMSIGPPGSGKTYLLLESLKHWLKNNVFDEYHIVAPAFENEMEDSYAFLRPYLKKEVSVYGMYTNSLADRLVLEAKRNNEKFRAGKIKRKPRVFFAVDDATGQRELFDSPSLERIIVENRHLNIHSWLLLHQDKKVVTPKIRENMRFIIIYPLHVEKLKYMFSNYINFPTDFENYKEFWEFWKEYVLPNEHASLLVCDRIGYTPDCRLWFK